MKANYLLTAVGLGIGLGAPSLVGAQTTQQPSAQQPQTQQKPKRRVSQTAKLVTPAPTKTEGIRRSGLPPAFFDQNDGGNHFTDSTMRSMTRAGDLGVETGTFGSDTNGQIGTTNQNNMVYYPMTYQGSFLTSHIGSGDTPKPAPVRAHRSPHQKTKDNNK